MTGLVPSGFKNLFWPFMVMLIITMGGFAFSVGAGAKAGEAALAGSSDFKENCEASGRSEAKTNQLVAGKSVVAGQAMVVADDSIAARVGAEVLQRGGNAVDAAVAVGFAMAVTYPRAGNIGGGGFCLVRLASGETRFIDYREKAPAAAHRDMYLDSRGKVIPDASLVGTRASGVPGTVAGLWLAHQTFGTMAWADLLEPACRLARNGFPAPDTLTFYIEDYRDELSSNPASKRIFLDSELKPGDVFIQPELARTLERIQDKGTDDFYRGETARLIAADMKKLGGLITMDDLGTYEAVFREPVTFYYRGYEVIGAPLPSSGGIITAQVLQMIEPLNIADLTFHSADHIHLLCEAERIAFRIRAVYLGDVDYYPSPWQGLLRWPYIKSLHHRLTPYRANTLAEIEAMDLTPPGRVPTTPPRTRIMHRLEHTETTHFSIVDRWGNAVSNSYTLNARFGSGVTIEGAGFLMNNEMDDFSIKPGVPNMYDLVGSEANAIEPGKRMLSSMSPTIVAKDGRLFMVVGSPGGSRIPTSVIQVISNVIDFKMPLAAAVAASRFHAQYLPDKIRVEFQTLEHFVRHDLESRGHKFYFKPRIGNIQAILKDDGRLTGVSDHRGAGRAIGY